VRTLYTLLFFVMLTSFSSPALGQNLSAKERDSMRNAQAETTRAARESVETLFARLCPGRCELIGVEVEMESPRAMGQVTPGFESVTPDAFSVDAKTVQVSVLLDSKLPRNFQRNIPRMIQHRLAALAPVISVRPELLDFPEPQLEPIPPYYPEPPRSAPTPAPLPKMDFPEPPLKVEEPPVSAPAPAESKSFMDALAPWIGPLVMAFLLFLMMLFMLKKISEISRPAAEGSTDLAKRSVVSLDDLKDELMASRPVKNSVMRKWLEDDVDGAARAIHAFGPELISDIKTDSALRPKIQLVADRLMNLGELTPEDLEKVIQDSRVRLRAAQVLHESASTPTEWEFLEGLQVRSIYRILEGLTPRELMHVVSMTRTDVQSALMEQLPERSRRDLFVSAGSPMSRSESQELAMRLRRAAEELSGTSGEAAVLISLLESLSAIEQEVTVGDLKSKRPDIAAEILRGTVLESSLLYMPSEVLQDASIRIDLEHLSAFLRGTDEATRNHFVASTSGSRRVALLSELELEIPVGRAQFLDGRKVVLAHVLGVMEREGQDITRANLRGLMKKPLNPVEANEASS